MAEGTDAQLLQVLCGHPAKDLAIDVIVAEKLGVLFKTQPTQPGRYFHAVILASEGSKDIPLSLDLLAGRTEIECWGFGPFMTAFRSVDLTRTAQIGNHAFPPSCADRGWEIERRLARDASRPIIFYTRAATCWRPRVEGLNLVVNSVFNSWRFEDVWLDR